MFAARQPMSVAGDIKILCMTNRPVRPGPDSIPKIFVAEMHANRNDPIRKMLLGSLVALTPVGGLAERGPATPVGNAAIIAVFLKLHEAGFGQG
jgi:hypothetical protein